MLKNILKILFSNKLTLLLLIAMSVSMAYGTFLENNYDRNAAMRMIYDAKWFELIIFLLAINFIGNIFKYNLLNVKKISVLMFHLAFIVIIIGAGITRYFSTNGIMHIREGETTNLFISETTFVNIKIDNNEVQRVFASPTILSSRYFEFNKKYDFLGKELNLECINYISNAEETIVKNKGKQGEEVIHIVYSSGSGRENYYLKKGQIKLIGDILVSFNKKITDGINMTQNDKGEVFINAPFDMKKLKMSTQKTDVLKKGENYILEKLCLYSHQNFNFVVKEIYENAKSEFVESENNSKPDLITFKVSSGTKSQEISFLGGIGFVNPYKTISINGLNVSLKFGSEQYKVPFSIKLKEFVLETYPGSDSPASFSSYVDLVENDENKKTPYKIFMNNILYYKGYRFFQSSYDKDKKGTILSVNYDKYGTYTTYTGYFLLFISMIITLFNKNSRFRDLGKKIKFINKKSLTIFIILIGVHSNLFSKNDNKYPQNIDSLLSKLNVDKEHSDKFGYLIVQDNNGRMKPINSLASEIFRKIYKKEVFGNMNENQLLLSMIAFPIEWQYIPVIYVNKKSGLRDKFNAKYLPFMFFFDKNANYIIQKDIEQAYAKPPVQRTEKDKEIININERLSILYMIFNYSMLKIFPIKDDPNNKWVAPSQHMDTKDSVNVKMMINYIKQVKTKNWQKSDHYLKLIKNYQKNNGKRVIPSDTKVKMEIIYNKYKIFQRLMLYYLLIGISGIILYMINIFYRKKLISKLLSIINYISILLLIAHSLNLIMRSYISGHAPWTDAYESMVYVAWATVLSGIIFRKKSKICIPLSLTLSAIFLIIANMNWVNPEITNLVPVLKSYWLMIHVSIIISSYGFFGFSAFIGFISLFIRILANKNNKDIIKSRIKKFTYINEMSLIVGTFLLTIGTFLGAIWANESWGRYWGWDPKETWALISIIIYSFILHIRLVPKLNSSYNFNLFSVIGFGSILMTYFGVNHYLSGLHSYAKGDPVPIPYSLYITIIIITLVSVISFSKKLK